MSWTIAVRGVRSELGDAIYAAEPSGNEGPERDEQVAAAKAAAKWMLGATGRDNDDVSISLYGHANPDHGPRDGYSNETITVTVNVVVPAPPTSAPEPDAPSADTSSQVESAKT
jgi:hypothetical protein